MALARWQAVVTDGSGGAVVGATVDVFNEVGGARSTIYSDRAGAVPLGNPFTDDDLDGYIFFHVAGGSYRIVVTKGAFTREFRYVGIGTYNEFDVGDAVNVFELTFAGTKRIAARKTALGGAGEECTTEEILEFIAGTPAQGDTFFRGASAVQRLAAGTAGYGYQSNGPSANPSWVYRREVLTAARTYYVRTDGSNSNTGLADSAGGAFLTIQKAVDVACALDPNGNSVTIQVKDGTYTSPTTVNRLLDGSQLTIQGNSGTPANVVISTTSNSCFTLGARCNAKIKDLKVQTTTSGHCFNVSGVNCYLDYGNINFGACAERHIQVLGKSIVYCISNYAITGACTMHIALSNTSYLECYSKTITFTGSLAWGAAYIYCDQGSHAEHGSCTFTGGTLTGKRFDVKNGGHIESGGGGANYFPGNSAGTGTNFASSPWGLYS